MQNDECRMQNEQTAVICLVRDLMFYSKIRAAAATAGVTLKSIRDPAKLVDTLGTGLIVDLNQPDALPAAAAWSLQTTRPVVGFVSHVDTETIRAAKAAGIAQVIPRSQFEKNLPAILLALSQKPATPPTNPDKSRHASSNTGMNP